MPIALGLLAAFGLFLATRESSAASTSPPKQLPPRPDDKGTTVKMMPGETWKVVGYTDPGFYLTGAKLAAVLPQHQILKFIKVGDQGFGYTIKLGSPAMEIRSPSADPPINITSVQRTANVA